jgi:hypothetical protein
VIREEGGVAIINPETDDRKMAAGNKGGSRYFSGQDAVFGDAVADH